MVLYKAQLGHWRWSFSRQRWLTCSCTIGENHKGASVVGSEVFAAYPVNEDHIIRGEN